MPKFNTTKPFFDSLLGQQLSSAALQELLVYAKAELDEHNAETDEMKIELNDTNRPDLWSTAGLTRQLRSALDGGHHYDFFTTPEEERASGNRIIQVEAGLERIRPFIVGFEATGHPVNNEILKEIIHTQERLAWNYGRKRKSIAMGIYPAPQMRYPLHYRPCDPHKTAFTPLGMEHPLSLAEILSAHPKGQQFGDLIRAFDRYPCIVDDAGEILSMPPIINSAGAGEVTPGEERLFVELTGDNLEQLHTANNIVACDLHDMGFSIQPVTVRYENGRQQSYTTPYNFHRPQQARIKNIHRLLGAPLSTKQIQQSLARMGLACRTVKDEISVTLPPWRNDYLHEVDIIEDVMIGMGVSYFTPLPMSDFTQGHLLPMERLSRKIVRILVGLGFQEMIYNYLVSYEDFIRKMYPREQWRGVEEATIRIANPRSERHNMVRGSVIPSLLHSCAVSANAPLPHKIFEIGRTAVARAEENYGSVTEQTVGIVHSAVDIHFTAINEQLSAIMYYLGLEYRIEEGDDARFISGRCATIHHRDAVIGIMGELHPQVLENWHIQVPTTACELNVAPLLRGDEG